MCIFLFGSSLLKQLFSLCSLSVRWDFWRRNYSGNCYVLLRFHVRERLAFVSVTQSGEPEKTWVIFPAMGFQNVGIYPPDWAVSCPASSEKNLTKHDLSRARKREQTCENLLPACVRISPETWQNFTSESGAKFERTWTGGGTAVGN